MWSYYGSKLMLSKRYPTPKHSTIIEPFAGAAQYSLRYFENDVILVDKYEVVIRIWKWLQQCSKNDILSLPKIEAGTKITDYTWDCDEAMWLVGFIIAAGVATPRKSPSPWRTTLRPNSQQYKKQEMANSLHKIRHWKFIHGDYHCVRNREATWFIDPPYQKGGSQYKHSEMDYQELARWSMERRGQVIVCENSSADWLPFTYLADLHGVAHTTKEVMWTNALTYQV